MKIIQIAPTLYYGDAIGNYTIAIKHIIEDMGYQTAIYAKSVHPKVTEPDVYLVNKLPKLRPEDIVIYHLAIGDELNRTVVNLPCQRVMIYHNITPPHFFEKDSMEKCQICNAGLRDVRFLANKFDFCIADSEFNRQDLIRMGYDGDQISVVPVIVALDDYKQTPDAAMVERLRKDDWTNILFVGRVAPNKKHEDLIRSFAYYKSRINRKSRLLLVGNCGVINNYYDDLKEYIEALNVKDVEFFGHVSFAEILACYKASDLFLCMSEHEGFCVPLLEAMSFDLPIVAYKSTAVTETLGEGGVLLDSKDPILVARTMERLLGDHAWREAVVARQQKRFADFQYAPLHDRMQAVLQGVIDRIKDGIMKDDPYREYDALYDLVAERLAAQKMEIGFTRDAFHYTAEQSPHTIDLAKISDCDYDNRTFLEVSYLAYFGRLPDVNAYQNWAPLMESLTRYEFRKRVTDSLMATPEFRDKGTRISFNPYHDQPVPPVPVAVPSVAVPPKRSLVRRVGSKVKRMLKGER